MIYALLDTSHSKIYNGTLNMLNNASPHILSASSSCGMIYLAYLLKSCHKWDILVEFFHLWLARLV